MEVLLFDVRGVFSGGPAKTGEERELTVACYEDRDGDCGEDDGDAQEGGGQRRHVRRFGLCVC